uniref:Uncharacterized protein n=1 Tax=Onchocerca volvulus TaxID=6282 RepID=A0A8R1XZU7_ONCVO
WEIANDFAKREFKNIKEENKCKQKYAAISLIDKLYERLIDKRGFYEFNLECITRSTKIPILKPFIHLLFKKSLSTMNLLPVLPYNIEHFSLFSLKKVSIAMLQTFWFNKRTRESSGIPKML